MSKLRVLIVDDEEDMRRMLRALIEIANDGLSVAGEAVDGEEAVVRWREHRPDVIVLDEQMPKLSGLAAAERILGEDPAQKIVLFTASPAEAVKQRAERVGVRVVSKRDVARLVERLRACAAA